MKQANDPQVQVFIVHGIGGIPKRFANTLGEALKLAAETYQKQVASITEIEENSEEDYDVQPIIDSIEIKIDASICVYTGSETRTTHSIV